MRKHILIISLLFFLFYSCTNLKSVNTDYLVIYKQENLGEILPEYILLKNMNRYELYLPGNKTSILGDFEFENDTLILFPKYEYLDSLISISPFDTSIISISRKFLLDSNNLIDVTDYSKFPLLNAFYRKGDNVYKKVR